MMSDPIEEKVRAAIVRAKEWVRSLQREDGSWDAPSEETPANAAHHLLGTHYLRAVEPGEEAEIVRYLKAQQRSDGGWSGAPGEPSSLDDTVLCYLALRASGVPAEDERLKRARQVIENLGGLTGTSIVPRFFLTLLGQMPREAFPYFSPRLITSDWRLRQIWRTSGIYTLGSTALCMLNDHAAVRPLPEDRALNEFEPDRLRWRITPDSPGYCPSHAALSLSGKPELTRSQRFAIRASWTVIDRASRLDRKLDPLFGFEKARAKALDSALKLQGPDGTFGEMLLPTIMNLMALDYAGAGRYTAEVRKGLDAIRGWLVPGAAGARQQLAPSTTHTTSIAIRALLALQEDADRQPLEKAVRWLVEHQSVPGGRFGRSALPDGSPVSGWCFSVHGGINCDADQTSIVLQSLSPLAQEIPEAFDRALTWVLSMQDRNGGWAAYTRNCKPVPFISPNLFNPLANEVLMPEVDITARVLRVLGPLAGSRFDRNHRIERAVNSAIAFLSRRQRPEGAWFGRWVVNFAPATGQVIDALIQCGMDRNDPCLTRAAQWLLKVQNPDGGWGESKNSYKHDSFEAGPSNPIATAFTMKGLIAYYGCDHPAVLGGISWLLESREGAAWEDPGWNGVCIPGVSYMRYHVTPTALVTSLLAEWLEKRTSGAVATQIESTAASKL